MAKKFKMESIEAKDIKKCLEAQTDFAFEMNVLNAVKDHVENASFGGLYHDKVSGKTREFDIRAEIRIGTSSPSIIVKMAIECKNCYCPKFCETHL